MKNTVRAWRAHYSVSVTFLVVLALSGLFMLVKVYRKIRTRDEWQQNRVAFFSIWGLSCLFGTTWSLIFLDFGPLSVFVSFVFTIVNSFQGQCFQNTVPVLVFSLLTGPLYQCGNETLVMVNQRAASCHMF